MNLQSSDSFDWAFWFQWVMATTLGWLLGKILLPSVALLVSGYLVGAFQWAVLIRRLGKARRWAVASIVGWSAGSLIYLFAVPPALDLLAGAILGAAVGIAQWGLLRREYHWTGWWIPISVVAWMTGMTLLPGILSTAVTSGAITGIALDLILRYPKRIETGEHEGAS
jgi:hypothetical protein